MKQIHKILINYGLAILIVIYLPSRLLFLTRLPLFTDESIYIYWAKLIQTTHSQWFISLTDGKPPLLIWLIAIFLSVLPQKMYLVAGRVPSVISGLASLLALWYLALLLFKSKKAAFIACTLYIIHPFTFLYDRMALFDSMLSATLLWSVYFSLRTAKTLKYTDALFWGISLGLAFLSKPTALMFVFLTPVISFFYATKEHNKLPFKNLAIGSLIAIILSEFINNLQRISHVYFLAAIKNSQFQQPISELIKDPFHLTIGNMHGFFSWMISYYTIPFFILCLASFGVLLARKWKIGVMLVGLWILPIIALATVGREIFPRYILFTTPYALLAVSFFIVSIWQSKSRYASFLAASLMVFILPLLVFSYFLLFQPEKAPLPATDYHQYVSEHPSGYGLDKVFSFLNNKSMGQKITIVTQGTFGLYPYAFNLEYWGDPNVTILPRWPLDTLGEDILNRTKNEQVYVILKERQSLPLKLPLDIILRADKPGGDYPIYVTTPKSL